MSTRGLLNKLVVYMLRLSTGLVVYPLREKKKGLVQFISNLIKLHEVKFDRRINNATNSSLCKVVIDFMIGKVLISYESYTSF